MKTHFVAQSMESESPFSDWVVSSGNWILKGSNSPDLFDTMEAAHNAGAIAKFPQSQLGVMMIPKVFAIPA